MTTTTTASTTTMSKTTTPTTTTATMVPVTTPGNIQSRQAAHTVETGRASQRHNLETRVDDNDDHGECSIAQDRPLNASFFGKALLNVVLAWSGKHSGRLVRRRRDGLYRIESYALTDQQIKRITHRLMNIPTDKYRSTDRPTDGLTDR